MTRIYRNLSDYPILENHLRSINEILNSYQENQSIPRVKIFSHEIEGLLPSSAFYNNKFQELVFNGSLQKAEHLHATLNSQVVCATLMSKKNVPFWDMSLPVDRAGPS